jgi:hypothetical protein
MNKTEKARVFVDEFCNVCAEKFRNLRSAEDIQNILKEGPITEIYMSSGSISPKQMKRLKESMKDRMEVREGDI